MKHLQTLYCRWATVAFRNQVFEISGCDLSNDFIFDDGKMGGQVRKKVNKSSTELAVSVSVLLGPGLITRNTTPTDFSPAHYYLFFWPLLSSGLKLLAQCDLNVHTEVIKSRALPPIIPYDCHGKPNTPPRNQTANGIGREENPHQQQKRAHLAVKK